MFSLEQSWILPILNNDSKIYQHLIIKIFQLLLMFTISISTKIRLERQISTNNLYLYFILIYFRNSKQNLASWFLDIKNKWCFRMKVWKMSRITLCHHQGHPTSWWRNCHQNSEEEKRHSLLQSIRMFVLAPKLRVRLFLLDAAQDIKIAGKN